MIQYDPDDWRSHLWDIKGSMIREIAARVLSFALWSVAVVCAAELWIPKLNWLAIPSGAHTLTGFALSLLLVFRTNSSYDRFWEGRKLWGSIVNESRNLARAASVYMAADPSRVARVVLWGCCLPWATMHRLRGTRGIGPVDPFLPPHQVDEVLAAPNQPLAVARRISRELAEGREQGLMTDIVMTTIDQNVQILVDCLGACERIRNTRLPYAYMVHLRRALILYNFTLPFALIESFGWLTIPAVLLISYVLFGIEEIGVEIEDPFGTDANDLPLEQFCANIEADLRALLPHAGQYMTTNEPSASA
jgi:putative membrane protein